MRWMPSGRSDDLEDRRDGSGGGGGGGFNFGGIHIGIGGFIILLALSLVFKRNFLSLAGVGGGSNSPTQLSQPDPARDRARDQKEEGLQHRRHDCMQHLRAMMEGNSPLW